MITPLFWKNGASARWRNKAIRGTRAEVPLELFCLNYFFKRFVGNLGTYFSCFDCSVNGFIETSFVKSTNCFCKEVIHYYLIPNLLPTIDCLETKKKHFFLLHLYESNFVIIVNNIIQYQ